MMIDPERNAIGDRGVDPEHGDQSRERQRNGDERRAFPSWEPIRPQGGAPSSPRIDGWSTAPMNRTEASA